MITTQRTITVLVLAVPLAILLAGCAAATSTPAPAPSDETAEPTAEESFSVTVTDGLGSEVTLDHKPGRIASLTLGTDEVLLDLVGPERLVAVTYLTTDATTSNIADDPRLAQIEHKIDTDPEQIIALEPDLVLLASWTDSAIIEQLTNAGLPVFVVGNFTSIDAMQDNILTLGELVGEPEAAAAMVADMDAQLAEIEASVDSASGDAPTVLYLAHDGWVAGSATTVDDIVTRAGGINAGAAAGIEDWAQVNEEAILGMDPDVVILSPYVTEDEFLGNPVFADMRAVQEGRAVPVSDATLSATSQYIVLGVRDVAAALYPEAVSQP